MSTISRKVILASIAMFLLCTGIAGVGLWTSNQMAVTLQETSANATILRNQMEADMMHDALRADVLAAMLAAQGDSVATPAEARADFQEHAKAFQDALAANRAIARDPDVRAVIQALEAPLGAYIAKADRVIGLSSSNLALAKVELPEFLKSFKVLEGVMETAGDKIEAKSHEADDVAASQKSLNAIIGVTALLLAILSSLGLLILARQTILKPLKSLTTDMEALARGRVDITLRGANRRDEIGAIGRAVRAFQEVVVNHTREEAEAAEKQRLAATEAETRAALEAGERARAQLAVVDALSAALAQLAKGDLTRRILEPFPDDYERLRADFNDTLANLQDTIRTIQNRAQTIRLASQEITDGSRDLSKRTERQAASLEETAAALTQLTQSLNSAAEGAKSTQAAVATSKSEAEKSGNIVVDAVSAMEEIEQSSSKIGQIIGVIDEIAFQTNLLALNAGVEAARAGEAGRGFAVVASEVRALAQRSADAAKEIKTLISTSASQVNHGVRLVGETGETLKRITQQVLKIDDLVRAISRSSVEQATGLAEVSSAVTDMDRATQQNAAMVEQSSTATKQLHDDVEALFGLIGRFTVGEPLASTQRRAA